MRARVHDEEPPEEPPPALPPEPQTSVDSQPVAPAPAEEEERPPDRG